VTVEKGAEERIVGEEEKRRGTKNESKG